MLEWFENFSDYWLEVGEAVDHMALGVQTTVLWLNEFFRIGKIYIIGSGILLLFILVLIIWIIKQINIMHSKIDEVLVKLEELEE